MSSTTSHPAIEATDLSRSLPLGQAQVSILRGVSLTVEHGEWLALTGPSGSGKSTLLGLMAGLDTPSSGRIVLDGVDITHLGESELAAIRNQKVGVVFQAFNLIPSLSAQENVEVPLYVNPDRKRIRERASEMLELVAGAVLIANAVGLAMVERQRELGILKAVGYSSRSVLQVILLENGLLGVLAGAGGTLATAIAVPILNQLQPALGMQFNWPLAIGMAALAVALALAAAGAAAWGPARQRPLAVLRNE